MSHPAAERLVERCCAAEIVALDSVFFIYHFQDHPDYGPLTTGVLAAVEAGRFRAVGSSLVLTEVLVHPLRCGAEAEAGDYYALLTTFPNLRLVAPGPEVALAAAGLRASEGLRTPDAIHLATALAEKARLFLTNDHRLARQARILCGAGAGDRWQPGGEDQSAAAAHHRAGLEVLLLDLCLERE